MKMSASRTLFKVVLYWVLIVTCHGFFWWRRSVISMEASRPSENLLAQRFTCAKRLSYPIHHFDLNVTLNASAYLQEPEEAVLKQSSADNTWHLLKSPDNFYAEDDFDVEFMLIYNKSPAGNCSFNIDEESDHSEDPTGMTTLYMNMTSSSEFENATEPHKESTSRTTTKSMATTDPSSTCLCPCECISPLSKEREDAMLAEMLQNLRIQKSKTSFSKRKLSSATDIRLSSKSIGLVGAFVLASVFGVILIGDAKLFLRNARTALGHFRERFQT